VPAPFSLGHQREWEVDTHCYVSLTEGLLLGGERGDLYLRAA
jgi:hypothetical protein